MGLLQGLPLGLLLGLMLRLLLGLLGYTTHASVMCPRTFFDTVAKKLQPPNPRSHANFHLDRFKSQKGIGIR